MMAAQILRGLITGTGDPDADLFSFRRRSDASQSGLPVCYAPGDVSAYASRPIPALPPCRPGRGAARLLLLGAYLLAPALWRRHEAGALANRAFPDAHHGRDPGDPSMLPWPAPRPAPARHAGAGWSPAIRSRSAPPSRSACRCSSTGPIGTRRSRRSSMTDAGRTTPSRSWWAGARTGAPPCPLLAHRQRGRRPFLGAASFDRGVGMSRLTGQITHHIAPDIDTERDRLMQALAEAGAILIGHSSPGWSDPHGRNAAAAPYVTDGDILVASLMDAPARGKAPARRRRLVDGCAKGRLGRDCEPRPPLL